MTARGEQASVPFFLKSSWLSDPDEFVMPGRGRTGGKSARIGGNVQRGLTLAERPDPETDFASIRKKRTDTDSGPRRSGKKELTPIPVRVDPEKKN